MKLKIEGTEVVIDWGAQTVAIRKAPEAGEFTAAKGGEWTDLGEVAFILEREPAVPLVHWHTATEHCKGGCVDGGWGEVTCPDCLRSNPEEKPVYGWVKRGSQTTLTVDGVGQPRHYVWKAQPDLFRAFPGGFYYPTRQRAEAAVIYQYEDDHA